MRRIKMILMMLALSFCVTGVLYAFPQSGAFTELHRPIPSKTVKRPGEGSHHRMTACEQSVAEHSLALSQYARETEGALSKKVVDEHIRGIDRGIEVAEKLLARLEKKVGEGTPAEREELAGIRAHQEAAVEALARLKREAADSPMSNTAIAADAETIHNEVMMAGDEARTLAIHLGYRNPGEAMGYRSEVCA